MGAVSCGAANGWWEEVEEVEEGKEQSGGAIGNSPSISMYEGRKERLHKKKVRL
jgi:hypothetical protein